MPKLTDKQIAILMAPAFTVIRAPFKSDDEELALLVGYNGHGKPLAIIGDPNYIINRFATSRKFDERPNACVWMIPTIMGIPR